MKVKDYMSSPVVTISPYDTLGKARNLMLERGVHRLVVVDEKGAPVGVISISDIIRAVSSGGPPWRWRDKSSALLMRYMSKDPVTIGAEETVAEAARIMVERNVSCLPVMLNRELVGIITKTDMTRLFSERFRGALKVRDLMRNPTFVRETLPVKKVLKLFSKKREDAIVVVASKERPVGFLTERDLFFYETSRAKGYSVINSEFGRISSEIKERRVSEVAREIRATLNPELDAAKAARMMLDWGVTGLPVADGDKLIGVLTKRDIVRGVSIVSSREEG
ncbi:MAG: CBS domain-containing protein [Candidatus Methanodesulfokora washburnensis]|jgi:CBS domain-containing protein